MSREPAHVKGAEVVLSGKKLLEVVPQVPLGALQVVQIEPFKRSKWRSGHHLDA